jgi:hypothetical protein
VVCLLSALRFHELTTQAPHEVWIAIPNKAQAPRQAYPPISACLGAGASNELIALCLRGEIMPLMGTALLAEYEDVLGREAWFERSRLDSAERDELLDTS